MTTDKTKAALDNIIADDEVLGGFAMPRILYVNEPQERPDGSLMYEGDAGRFHARHKYILAETMPADWHEDSSLATWFPITAEELEKLRAETAPKNTDNVMEYDEVIDFIVKAMRVSDKNEGEGGGSYVDHARSIYAHLEAIGLLGRAPAAVPPEVVENLNKAIEMCDQHYSTSAKRMIEEALALLKQKGW